MAMLETAEIRWFFKDAAPAAVRDWFAEDRDLIFEERTDRYLVFPGCESVGVKLRDAEPGGETRLEVKAIRDAPEVLNFPNGVTGRASSWVKWSHPTGALDQLPTIGDGDTAWVPTESGEFSGDSQLMKVPCGKSRTVTRQRQAATSTSST